MAYYNPTTREPAGHSPIVATADDSDTFAIPTSSDLLTGLPNPATMRRIEVSDRAPEAPTPRQTATTILRIRAGQAVHGARIEPTKQRAPLSARLALAASLIAASTGLMRAAIEPTRAMEDERGNSPILQEAEDFCEGAAAQFNPETGEFIILDSQDQVPQDGSFAEQDGKHRLSIPILFAGIDASNIRQPIPIAPPTEPAAPPTATTDPPTPTSEPAPPTEPVEPAPSKELPLPSGLRVAVAPDALADWPITTAPTATYGARVASIDGDIIRVTLPDGSTHYAQIDDIEETPEMAELMKQISMHYPEVDTEYPPVTRRLRSNTFLDSRANFDPPSQEPLLVNRSPSILTLSQAQLNERWDMLLGQKSEGEGEALITNDVISAVETRKGSPVTLDIDADIRDPLIYFVLGTFATMPFNSGGAMFVVENGNLIFGHKEDGGQTTLTPMFHRIGDRTRARIEISGDGQAICASVLDPATYGILERMLIRTNRSVIVDQPDKRVNPSEQTTNFFLVSIQTDARYPASTYVRDLSLSQPSSPESIALAEGGLDPSMERVFRLQKPEIPFRLRDHHNNIGASWSGDRETPNLNPVPEPSNHRFLEQFTGVLLDHSNTPDLNIDPSSLDRKYYVPSSWQYITRLGYRPFTNEGQTGIIRQTGTKVDYLLSDTMQVDGIVGVIPDSATGAEILHDFWVPLLTGYNDKHYNIRSLGFFNQNTGTLGEAWRRLLTESVRPAIDEAHPGIGDVVIRPQIFAAKNLRSVTYQDNIVNAVFQAREMGFTVDDIVFDINPPEGVTLEEHLFGLEAAKAKLQQSRTFRDRPVRVGVTGVTLETFDWAFKFTRDTRGDKDALLELANMFDVRNEGKDVLFSTDRNSTVSHTPGFFVVRDTILNEGRGSYVVESLDSTESKTTNQEFTPLEKSLINQGAVPGESE